MRYYLETNSIRKLSKYLDNAFIKKNCFTSIQVFSELLTDINEANFYIKKNVLNKIFESGISIDWIPPHQKQYESFGFFNVKYNLNKDIILLFYDIIKNSACLSDFNNGIQNYANEYKKLKDYDKAFETYFKKEMSDKIKDFRSVFSFQEGITVCDDIIEYLNTKKEGIIYFILAMCLVMAEDLYYSDLNKFEKRTIKEIAGSFNGDIIIFLIISGVYCIKKVPRNEQISRNDFNDLYHLVYANNSIVVSDDNIFSKYMSEIFPDSIISTVEFEKLLVP